MEFRGQIHLQEICLVHTEADILMIKKEKRVEYRIRIKKGGKNRIRLSLKLSMIYMMKNINK